MTTDERAKRNRAIAVAVERKHNIFRVEQDGSLTIAVPVAGDQHGLTFWKRLDYTRRVDDCIEAEKAMGLEVTVRRYGGFYFCSYARWTDKGGSVTVTDEYEAPDEAEARSAAIEAAIAPSSRSSTFVTV